MSVQLQQVTEAPACCADLSAPLERGEAETLAALLKALADPARLQIVSLVNAKPDREVCACELAAPLHLSQPTVSHHLKILHEAGVLDRERRGTWIYYRLRTDRLDAIATAISDASPRVEVGSN